MENLHAQGYLLKGCKDQRRAWVLCGVGGFKLGFHVLWHMRFKNLSHKS